MEKKIFLTGARPTNNLHLGNYFGSISNIGRYNNNNAIYIFAADLHGLTTNKKIDRNVSIELLRWYHEVCPNAFFYIQSDYNEASYLAWLLACNTPLGKLEQMTQFKDKKLKNNKVGLLIYPILMAADIAIMGANLIPVGRDQRQHLELARDIIRVFNRHYPGALVEPQAIIAEQSQIYDLQTPEKKMSKSSEAKGTIYLSDKPEEVKKKIMRAKTDDKKMPTFYEADRIGVNNLINLYVLSGGSIDHGQVYRKFGNGNISLFKKHLVDSLIIKLQQIQPTITHQDMELLIENHKPIVEKKMISTINRIKGYNMI